MNFGEIFRFEFNYRVRRISTWLFFIVLGAVSYLGIIANYLYDAKNGYFLLNAPWVIAMVTLIGSQLAWLIGASIAGSAAAKDFRTGLYPLMFTSPLSKNSYLGGRFTASFLINVILVSAVPIGVLISLYTSNLNPELLGPFRPAKYLSAWFFLAVPNAFIGTAVQFSFSSLSRKNTISFIGGILLILISRIGGPLVTFVLGLGDLGYLVDPTGIFFVSDLLDGWATAETNSNLILLEGTLLWNRLLWVGISAALLSITWKRFRFSHSAEISWWRKIWTKPKDTTTKLVETDTVESGIISIPQSQCRFTFKVHLHQIIAIMYSSFQTIVWRRSMLFFLTPFLLILLTLPQNLEFWNLEMMTVPMFARTDHIISFLTAPLASSGNLIWMILSLLIIFYAEKLVWKERNAGVSEITDASPVPEWVLLIGKFLGLILVLVLLMILFITAGILIQWRTGYYNIEWGLYLQVFLGLQLSEYMILAMFALVIHMTVNQKQIGRLIALAAYGSIAFPHIIGLEHNLLIFGGGPEWVYSDMRGFGSSIGPWLWFKSYWIAWAFLIAVIARLFWVRSTESNLRSRINLAKERFKGATAGLLVLATIMILTIGGYVYYNTNILNEYKNNADRIELSAEYELRYGKFEDIPQLQMTETKLNIELHPKLGMAIINGIYNLKNTTRAVIDTIHIATTSKVETEVINFERSFDTHRIDNELGHRIYVLKKPLKPGDSLEMNFKVRANTNSFTNSGINTSVYANGTYFTSDQWLPDIGYQSNREITNSGLRREMGLSPQPEIPSLYDMDARKKVSSKIMFEALIGTDADQTVIAPGELKETWTKDDRRYYRYSTLSPIGDDYAIFSANYIIHEAKWDNPLDGEEDVSIQIYRHPDHQVNIEQVVQSVQASLDYCTEKFGPYGHPYLRIIEYPGHGTGLHAESATITHQEGFTRMNPANDPNALDFVFAVIGHEMGHTCRGMNYAPVEGAGLMAEGLAWYRAMKVVEENYGVAHLRKLLAQMRREAPIAPQRINPPLLQAASPYLSYRKGPFAMYAMQHYIGERQVTHALQQLHKKQDSVLQPVTSLDLYRELQAVTPDSLKYLLHDLFEQNIVWEFDTKSVSAYQDQQGDYQVTLKIKAKKVLIDSTGIETKLPIDDWVEIGVFTETENIDWPGRPLYLKKHLITTEVDTIVVKVSHKPTRAGIDPFDLLDWQDYDVIEVEIEKADTLKN